MAAEDRLYCTDMKDEAFELKSYFVDGKLIKDIYETIDKKSNDVSNLLDERKLA